MYLSICYTQLQHNVAVIYYELHVVVDQYKYCDKV